MGGEEQAADVGGGKCEGDLEQEAADVKRTHAGYGWRVGAGEGVGEGGAEAVGKYFCGTNRRGLVTVAENNGDESAVGGVGKLTALGEE